MSALLWICFASIFIILLFVFVVENGHETCGPWDVQEPRSDDSWPLLLCQLHEATADQSERLQEEVGCQLWSVQIWWQWQVHYIYELNLGDLFVFVCYWLGRSNLSAQQKPLRPRKFKSYNSSWQRPAQTIQIRTDKNMSADSCHELLLEEMQTRVWELHRSCISWRLGRILEWNAVQPSIGNWRLSVLLLQTKGHWRSYSNCTVSRKRWDWWWVMPCPREYSQYSLYFCWILLDSFGCIFLCSPADCLDSLAV